MIPLGAATLSACAERLPVPGYDRSQVTPAVAHIGVGGFHRAHQAMVHDRLLHADAGWGIRGIGVLSSDRAMRDALRAQDGLYTLVVKHPDGSCEGRVIGSLVDYVYAPEDPSGAVDALVDPATRIVSLTITESGYDASSPSDAFALVIDALARRRDQGMAPFTVMSCDNLEDNGHRARAALLDRVPDPGLAEWIEREVRFPNAMVDRITPATTDADRRLVAERFGIEDRWPVVCESFVQWVLEDDFGAGRPPYETAGVQLVGDVRPYELMKLRLLNAGHQGLAYFAQLCGYALVHDAARDELIAGFLLAYMDEEATPTLAPVPGIDLHAYKRTLIERFANPGVRDTVDRLCVDSAARLSAFVLPAIREQLATGGEIRRGAAILASWAVWAEGAGVGTTPAELLGDLAGDPRFAEAYRGTLASLRERGPRETLAELLAGGV